MELAAQSAGESGETGAQQSQAAGFWHGGDFIDRDVVEGGAVIPGIGAGEAKRGAKVAARGEGLGEMGPSHVGACRTGCVELEGIAIATDDDV